MTNINDYHSIPTSEYRRYVDDLQTLIRRINAEPISEEIRLSLLKGCLRSLLAKLDA